MADELGSAYIELGAKVPSAADVQKQVDETERLYREAVARASRGPAGGGFDPDDPGVAALRAKIAARHESSRAALVASRVGMVQASTGLSPDIAGAKSQLPPTVEARVEQAQISGDAPGIADRMKAIELAQLEAQRKANEEVGKFSGFLRGANNLLAFAGIGGFGVAGIRSVFNSIQQRADYGTSMSNPLQSFQKEQIERDISGSVGRRFATLTQGNLQREQNQREAFADPNSLASRQARQTSALMNFLKNLNPVNWLESWEASRARERGITGVGAGHNPMLGHTMGIDEYFSGLTMATMQTPNDPQTANIRTIEANTDALLRFADEVKQTTARIKALTPEIP